MSAQGLCGLGEHSTTAPRVFVSLETRSDCVAQTGVQLETVLPPSLCAGGAHRAACAAMPGTQIASGNPVRCGEPYVKRSTLLDERFHFSGMGWCLSAIPALGKLRWQAFQFKASLGYILGDHQTKPNDLIPDFYVCGCFVPVFMSVPHSCRVPGDVKEDIGSPGSGVRDGCELSYRCWELSLGSQQDQHVLLTDQPSLQPQ